MQIVKQIDEFIGKIFTNVQREEDSIVFTLQDGSQYALYHEQDCCEDVSIEDIIGDLDSLIGYPILMAESVSHKDETPDVISLPRSDYSYTWTFYKFATVKGYVTIRWLGTSNGYYSEEVDLFFNKGNGEFNRLDI